MNEPRPSLSADTDRFTRLLNDALTDLPVGEVNNFLHTLAQRAGRAQEQRDSGVLIEWLEGVAITHALRRNAEYKVALKDHLTHDDEPPVPVDLDELRLRLTATG